MYVLQIKSGSVTEEKYLVHRRRLKDLAMNEKKADKNKANGTYSF